MTKYIVKSGTVVLIKGIRYELSSNTKLDGMDVPPPDVLVEPRNPEQKRLTEADFDKVAELLSIPNERSWMRVTWGENEEPVIEYRVPV